MFQPKEFVIYGTCGICEILAVGPLASGAIDPERIYYTLQPVYGSETIYTPVDTSVFIRQALNREEAERLIAQIPAIEEAVCTERSIPLLKAYYEKLFQTHACEDLIQVIKSVYRKNQNALDNGRKVGQLDQRYMKRAEELLYGELSIALDIARDEVVGFIEKKVDIEEPYWGIGISEAMY